MKTFKQTHLTKRFLAIVLSLIFALSSFTIAGFVPTMDALAANATRSYVGICGPSSGDTNKRVVSSTKINIVNDGDKTNQCAAVWNYNLPSVPDGMTLENVKLSVSGVTYNNSMEKGSSSSSQKQNVLFYAVNGTNTMNVKSVSTTTSSVYVRQGSWYDAGSGFISKVKSEHSINDSDLIGTLPHLVTSLDMTDSFESIVMNAIENNWSSISIIAFQDKMSNRTSNDSYWSDTKVDAPIFSYDLVEVPDDTDWKEIQSDNFCVNSTNTVEANQTQFWKSNLTNPRGWQIRSWASSKPTLNNTSSGITIPDGFIFTNTNTLPINGYDDFKVTLDFNINDSSTINTSRMQDKPFFMISSNQTAADSIPNNNRSPVGGSDSATGIVSIDYDGDVYINASKVGTMSRNICDFATGAGSVTVEYKDNTVKITLVDKNGTKTIAKYNATINTNNLNRIFIGNAGYADYLQNFTVKNVSYYSTQAVPVPQYVKDIIALESKIDSYSFNAPTFLSSSYFGNDTTTYNKNLLYCSSGTNGVSLPAMNSYGFNGNYIYYRFAIPKNVVCFYNGSQNPTFPVRLLINAETAQMSGDYSTIRTQAIASNNSYFTLNDSDWWGYNSNQWRDNTYGWGTDNNSTITTNTSGNSNFRVKYGNTYAAILHNGLVLSNYNANSTVNKFSGDDIAFKVYANNSDTKNSSFTSVIMNKASGTPGTVYVVNGKKYSNYVSSQIYSIRSQFDNVIQALQQQPDCYNEDAVKAYYDIVNQISDFQINNYFASGVTDSNVESRVNDCNDFINNVQTRYTTAYNNLKKYKFVTFNYNDGSTEDKRVLETATPELPTLTNEQSADSYQHRTHTWSTPSSQTTNGVTYVNYTEQIGDLEDCTYTAGLYVDSVNDKMIHYGCSVCAKERTIGASYVENLNAAIQNAKAIINTSDYAERYTETSRNTLKAALDNSVSSGNVISNVNFMITKYATESDIDNQIAAIQTALEELVIAKIKYTIKYEVNNEYLNEYDYNGKADASTLFDIVIPDALSDKTVYKWAVEYVDKNGNVGNTRKLTTQENRISAMSSTDANYTVYLTDDTVSDTYRKVTYLDKSGRVKDVKYVTTGTTLTVDANEVILNNGERIKAVAIPYYSVNSFQINGKLYNSDTDAFVVGSEDVTIRAAYTAGSKYHITVSSRDNTSGDVKIFNTPKDSADRYSYDAIWDEKVTLGDEGQIVRYYWYINDQLVWSGNTFTFRANESADVTYSTRCPLSVPNPYSHVGYFNYDPEINKVTAVIEFSAFSGDKSSGNSEVVLNNANIKEVGVILSTKSSDKQTVIDTGTKFKATNLVGVTNDTKNQAKITVSRTAKTAFTMYAVPYITMNDGNTYYGDIASTSYPGA